MATSLLVPPGSAVLPLEYSFICPSLGAAWEMDRFIPSSRQPQHWSRNYHGSQERRRSLGRQKESAETQEKGASAFRQGVTLRAEDLLADSDYKLGYGSRLSPANHLAPQPVLRKPEVTSTESKLTSTEPKVEILVESLHPQKPDSESISVIKALSIINLEKQMLRGKCDARRTVLGGSATEQAQCNRPRAPLRRSSEGTYARQRKSSSSSSNAADDPTSSDPSSSCTTTSASSSSSESGCNADSETCSYCRLTESSEEREASTDDDRTSLPSPPKVNGDCRRLTRALSEDCNPPSRPIRRTSPGEYLRHKRDQMEKLRSEQFHDAPSRRQKYTFHRCDSDPRLSRRHKDSGSSSRTLTFASPTKNRIKKTTRKKAEPEEVISKVILPVPPIESIQSLEVERPIRSALAKNITERRSRSKERRSSVVRNAEQESMPFLQRRASFRCAVCDCDIPFTNCVLCNAEAKAAFASERNPSDVFITECDVVSLNSEDLVIDGEQIRKVIEVEEESVQSYSEKKELEEFYDDPTPVEPPPMPAVQSSSDDKQTQWTSKKAIHKSFSQDEHRKSRRSSLRKYNSEPVSNTEEFQHSREQSEARTQSTGDVAEQRESSASSSSKSEHKARYYSVRDSPRTEASQQKDAKSLCHFCGKTAEEEEILEKSKPQARTTDAAAQLEKSQRKSPVYLKPEFHIEPEIIHKANPLVDEADVDVLPSAVGAFRRLSEEEFISTLNIHEAAKKGDLHVVKLLTKKDPKQMETVDERGWTPIHLAAAHGHTEVVKYLAIEGAHLAALDPSSYTAIHLAAMNGHNTVLEVLLPMGVDIDSITAEGFTALHLAIMNTHLECIQTLLQWGARTDKKDALGRGIQDMVEEYNLQEVAALLRRFHKQLHNFKHMLDILNREGRNSSALPPEFMDMLASIEEESGPE